MLPAACGAADVEVKDVTIQCRPLVTHQGKHV